MKAEIGFGMTDLFFVRSDLQARIRRSAARRPIRSHGRKPSYDLWAVEPASLESGELSEFLGKKIVKGDTRFVVVALHGLANINDGPIQLRVGRGQAELLLQEASRQAIPLRLVLAAT
jgi:hypothetical protein